MNHQSQFLQGIHFIAGSSSEWSWVSHLLALSWQGPVHAYTGISGGHITYLSELESGGQVLAVDAHGHSRTVLVGRVSIESKPLVLVVAEAEGECFSVMLEDADSVRLVVPSYMQHPGSEAIPVTKLQPGDMILLGMEVGDYSYGQ